MYVLIGFTLRILTSHNVYLVTGFSAAAFLLIVLHAVFRPRTTSSMSYVQIYMKKDILGVRGNDNGEDYISGDDDDDNDIKVIKADRTARMDAFERRHDALKARYRFPTPRTSGIVVVGDGGG